MNTDRTGPLLMTIGIIFILLGLALGFGGIWLITLGGSWYYGIAGLGFLVTGFLLIRRQASALWIYALVVAGTLVWALWETGLDWWPLAARGDVVFVLGLLLITPWVTRALGRAPAAGAEVRARPVSAFRGGGLALTATLVIALGVGVASWVNNPHRLEGAAPPARSAMAANAQEGPLGEWRAYGGSNYGQRYSPLDQITPENVSALEVAWTYHTGDVRGESGDPDETTFEVTPLKIGDRLFFCTPHQYVVALDAETGAEIWVYDPVVKGKLALEHLTCRGLSYHAARATPQTPGPAGGDTATLTPAEVDTETADLPIASQDTPGGADICPAKLFMPTADGRVIALDPETGTVCGDFGGGTGQINLWTNMPYVNPGSYYSTSPIVVTQDLIIVGGSVNDNVSTTEPSGVIRAFDVDTGELVWNWDSGDPEHTEPLAPGETYTPNSPNSWSILSADEALGLVYVPLGNQPPDQWGGNRTEAVEEFSSAIVALDIKTGQMRWKFQTVHHDLWDYDIPSQPSLIDLTIGDETVPALVQPTKQGEIFVLDRRTGEPVLPVREVPAPQGAAEGDFVTPTQPVSALSYGPSPLEGRDMWGATMFDQLVCRIAYRQLRYEGRFTPPSTQGSLSYPGNFGTFNWGSIAVDPVREIAFVTPTYLAFTSKLIPRANDEDLYVHDSDVPQGNLPALNENFGAPFAVELEAFTSPLGIPCQEPPWGYVAAVDLTNGETIWMHKNGTVRDRAPVPLPFKMGVPNLGGPIMTAGGVAFLSGTLDYYVRAYDVTTGDQLWESRLPAGGQATPMTYLGSDDRQYLLVIAGGHGSLGTKAGDAVIAYALPD